MGKEDEQRRLHQFLSGEAQRLVIAAARDVRMSLRAKGVVTLLAIRAKADADQLSCEISAQQLADLVREGRAAVEATARELEQLGYLTRTRGRKDGQFSGSVWTFHTPPAADRHQRRVTPHS